MRGWNPYLALLGFALAFGTTDTLAQDAPTYPVTISVTDVTGAAIAHAVVHLDADLPSTLGKMETDQAGNLHGALERRVYDISVSAPNFQTTRQLARVVKQSNARGSSQVIPIILNIIPVGGMLITATDSIAIHSLDKQITYSLEQFAALPHVTLNIHNAHTDADEAYSGVPLAALLEKAGAPLGKDLHGDAMSRYLLAAGSDGYTVVLSLAEVDPSFHAGQVIVADARDGKPLGDRGPFQLIVSDDKRPARWVHNLVSITLANGR